MHLKIAIVLAILFVVILAGLASASTGSAFFLKDVQIETFEDGSGRAVNAEGELLFFCMQGYPCDHSLPTSTIYLPMIEGEP